MNIHIRILLLAVLSLIFSIVAQSVGNIPGPGFFTQPLFWFILWGISQIYLAYSSQKLLKIKNRSQKWALLVLFFGVLGIVYIYLIPRKKLI